MMRRLVVIAMVMFAAGVEAQTPAPATSKQPAVAGNAETGKRLYTDMTCFFCHGTAGQGGVAGARIAQVPRSVDAFIRYIRRPTGGMPAFTDRLVSDQQLIDIYAFLRAQPAAKPAKDIPLLSKIKGR